MKRFLKVICLLSAVLCATVTSAQDEARRADQPEIKVGDWWQYQVRDDWTGVIKSTYKITVVAISGDVVTLGRESGVVSTMTRSLNTLQTSTTRYVPHSGLFEFPLVIGKTSVVKATFESARNSGSYEMSSKVTGWEMKRVPAGEFKTLVVLQEGLYNSREGTSSGSGRQKRTGWFSPECRCTVATSYEDTNWRGSLNNRTTTELVNYKLAD